MADTEQVERWANYVKQNPNSWKALHSEFINAQFAKANAFYDSLKKTPEGRKKLDKLIEMRKSFK